MQTTNLCLPGQIQSSIGIIIVAATKGLSDMVQGLKEEGIKVV